MADNEVKIIITGNNESAVKALQQTMDDLAKASKTTKETAKSTSSLKDELMKMAGEFLTVGAAVNFIKDAVLDYANAEESMIALNQALKNNGTYTDELSDSLSKFSSEMMGLTGVEHEQIETAMTYGLTLGISTENIKGATQGALGLSAALHLDLNQAMKLTDAYLEGNTDKMIRILPELKNMSSDTERLAFVQQKMNDGLALSEAKMGGAKGTITEFKNEWNEVKEMIGGILAESLIPLMKNITGLMHVIEDLRPTFQFVLDHTLNIYNIIDKVNKIVQFFKDNVKTAGGEFKLAFGIIEDTVLRVVANITKPFTIFVDTFIIGLNALTHSNHKTLTDIMSEWDKELVDRNRKQKAANDELLKEDSKKNDKLIDNLKVNGKLSAAEQDKIAKAEIKIREAELKQEEKDRDEAYKAKTESDRKAYETKKAYVTLGLETAMDAAFKEGSTLASVAAATIRAFADIYSKKLLIAGAGDLLMDPVKGIAEIAGAASVRALGYGVASEIENHPVKMFAEGGTINEPIMGVGRSGQRYMFGEAGVETVTPGNNTTNNHGMTIHNITVQANDPVSFAKQMEQAARRMGKHAFA